MSKTLAQKGGILEAPLVDDGKLFREISPGGRAFNFEYIIRDYLLRFVAGFPVWRTPRNSSVSGRQRISRIARRWFFGEHGLRENLFLFLSMAEFSSARNAEFVFDYGAARHR